MRLTPGRRIFVSVFITTIFNLASIGATVAVLPRLISQELGASDPVVGLVTGSYALAGILMRPIAGRLADQRGRRPVIATGSLVSFLGTLVLFLPASIPILLFSRMLVGIGEGSLYTAGSTRIVDTAPVARRGRWIGLYGLAIWIGLALGAPAGETLRHLGGYTAVWVFAAACTAISTIVALLSPKENRAHFAEADGQPEGDKAPAKGGIVERGAIGPGAIMLLSAIGFATISGFAILHLEERGVSGAALVFAAFAGSLAVGRLLIGSLPDRYGSIPCAVGSMTAQIFGLVLLAEASSLAMAVVGGVITGAASSVIFPSLSLLVIGRVKASRRGAAMGTFTAFFDSGMLLGTPAAGVAAAAFGGYGASFFFAAICALVGALSSLLLTPPRSLEVGHEAG